MSSSNRIWYHKHIGRMETEKHLMESREDGSFLIRDSDTVKGAYVLSTIYQNRIHHYRIIPGEEGKLSIQAQQGVQRRLFATLEELVEYYGHSRRGLVVGLTKPIPQETQQDDHAEEQDEESDDEDRDEVSRGTQERNIVSKFLLASLSTVDTSKVDGPFLEQIRSYLDNDVTADVESMATPTPTLTFMKQLFAKDCHVLHKQLNKIMSQVDLMQALFERAGGAKHAGVLSTLARKRKSRSSDTDFDSLVNKLNDCTDCLQSLETTAFQMLRELNGSMESRPVSLTQTQSIVNGAGELTAEDDSEEVTFDVKIETGLGVGKKNQTIVVSLRDGRLRLHKPGDSIGVTYEHHQVLQLVKSRSKEQRLGIQLEGQNRNNYLFNSMQAREHFCQLIQLIRNRLRADEDKDHISVFVGTFNMGDTSPPVSLDSWLKSSGLGKTLPAALSQSHDMYVFGTQESSMAEKDWFTKLKTALRVLYDIDYEKLAFQKLWGIQLLILVKPEHHKKITHLQFSQVRTGIGNALGNKGAVGISFYFGSVSLCFICAHLTSGNEKCSRRNQNYHDILKGMGALKHKQLSQLDLTNQFTHLFFLGDLNYRIDLGATEIVEYAKKQEHHGIYAEDQLRKEKEKKSVFVGFEESAILFPPTYRFAKGTRTLDDYVWVKQKRAGIRINVPSYCDRVLWRSYPGTSIVNTSYGCTTDIMTSDHSPVFATFQIGGFKQYVSDAATPGIGLSTNNKAQIVIDRCQAKIQTSSKTNFYIEVHSVCFEGVVRSVPNNDWIHSTSDTDNYTQPLWKTSGPVLTIKPIITDQEYLEQQHLLLIFKSQEGDEAYAECCVGLSTVMGQFPVDLDRELIHQGHSVGEMFITMHVNLDHYKQKKDEENLYSDVDFITDQEDATSSSLDWGGSSPNKYRTRAHNSESEQSSRALANVMNTSVTMKARSRGGGTANSIDERPMLPIPRSSSQSSLEKYKVGGGSMVPMASSVPEKSFNGPPPPLPKRGGRELPREPVSNIHVTQRPPLPTPYISGGGTRSQEPHPPAVPQRIGGRSSLPDSSSGPVPMPKPRQVTPPTSVGGAPVPFKRKNSPGSGSSTSGRPPVAAKTSAHTSGQHPSLRAKMSSELPPLPQKDGLSSSTGYPTLPSKSPEPSSTSPPAVPRRQGARSPRLPSSVRELLQIHGLQHYTDVLIANGYDDVQFLGEVPDLELQEIGILDHSDRQRLLRAFASMSQ